MKVTFKVKVDGLSELDRKLAAMANKQEIWLANEVLKDTADYVPASGAPAGMYKRAYTDGNMIVYPGPYARYLYYGKVMVDAATGKGPMHFKDKNGNELIRFRKGATLKATDKDLVYTKSVHKNAQSHWFEASKAQNLDKWLRGVKKLAK